LARQPRIATGAADGETIVWDAASGNALTTLRAVGRSFDQVAITHVEFGPGARLVVTGAADGSARVWAATAGAPLIGSAIGTAYTFDKDSGEAVVATAGGPIKYWDGRRGGRALRTVPGPGKRVDFVELSADGKTLAYSSYKRGRTRVAVGPIGGPFQTHTLRGLGSFDISGDGQAILDDAGPPWLYRPADQQRVRIGGAGLQVHTGRLNHDGRHVLLGAYDGRVLLADLRDPARPIPLRDPALRGAADAQFSPDGSRLITIGGPAALVWDTATAKVVKRMRSYVGTVTSAAYSPDGTRIATGGDDRTIVIRDAHTYRRLETLNTTRAPLQLQFSPDGQRILMVPPDFTPAVIYTCRTCQPSDTVTRDARAQVTRALTPAEIKNFVDEDS
jgi:WD40 repeat protein